MTKGELFLEAEGTPVDRLNATLGWAAILIGVSWLASDILTTLSLYYVFFQGSLPSADWQAFLSVSTGRLLTAPASALLALIGYQALRRRTPRRVVLVVIIGLYCAGFAVESLLTAMRTPFFLGPNLYLLQGSVLAVGGTVFVMYGGRGFKLAGCLVAELGLLLFYMGGLTLPPGFADYTWITVVSTYFADYGPLGNSIGYNTYLFFLYDVAPAFLGTVAAALGAEAVRVCGLPRRAKVAKIGGLLLVMCGLLIGVMLIVISCFSGVLFFDLLAFTMNSLGLTPSLLGTASILAAGPIVSIVQATGGAFLILGCMRARHQLGLPTF